jgi:spermidine synthase
MSRARRRGAAAVARDPRISVSEEDGVRYLHFGTEWVQGAMRLAAPVDLELEYQQQMMAPLLLLSGPRRIAQLGLGAAALTKFCHRHLPDAGLTVVEISEQVLHAARQWFALPDDPARIEIVIDDARRFCGEPMQRGRYDWVQVDLYDRDARGPVHDDEGFYRSCRRLLAQPGVAVFNLFGRSFGPSFERIDAAFDGRALVLPASAAGNRVVLAAHGPPLRWPNTELHAQARRVARQFGLPSLDWLDRIGAQMRDPDWFEI